jgi:hypothetical protein
MTRVHVDDLKMSSGSRKQLESTVNQLRKIYRERTVHQGNEHDHLGMVLTYEPEKRNITLSMRSYIQGVLEHFAQDNDDEEIKVMKTPVNDNLFQVRKKTDARSLSKHRARQFHLTITKPLFLAKRGRPDILLAVSFSTTVVKQSRAIAQK